MGCRVVKGPLMKNFIYYLLNLTLELRPRIDSKILNIKIETRNIDCLEEENEKTIKY